MIQPIEPLLQQAVFRIQQSLKVTLNSARMDTMLLFGSVLAKPMSFFYSASEINADAALLQKIDYLITQRCQGVPIAYLIGTKPFMNFDLIVNSHVLIPRPETELLVECALENKASLPEKAWVADLGTGTGAIALSLVAENPNWHVVAIDYSGEALAVAQKNKEKYNLPSLLLVQSDWLQGCQPLSFDMIVSNPPYIRQNDMHLQQGDVRFEPRQALVSGADGLNAIRRIIKQAAKALKPSGYLLMEHGYDQADAVTTILQEFQFESIVTKVDFSQHDRVTYGQITP